MDFVVVALEAYKYLDYMIYLLYHSMCCVYVMYVVLFGFMCGCHVVVVMLWRVILIRSYDYYYINYRLCDQFVCVSFTH